MKTMNKWIGWVEDSQGYMVRFIGPTTRAWAKRKAREASEAVFLARGYSWVELKYAVRNELHDRLPTDPWFSRLNGEDLNLLINVLQGWK